MAYTNAIFYLDPETGADTARSAISGLTTGSFSSSGGLINVAKTAHGLVTGAVIDVSGAAPSGNYNGGWKITRVDADNFTLDNSSYAACTTVGTWTPRGGSSWADAWLTAMYGATGTRIAAGDVIRIKKSPDPTLVESVSGSTPTWTNASKTVTLATARTANISLCESGAGFASDQGANVVVTNGSTYRFKQGAGSLKMAFTAGAAVGAAATAAISSTDYSGYQQVSFWIRSTVALAAGDLQIKLIGSVTNTINVPAIPCANAWQVCTVNTAGALCSDVTSVQIYQAVDKGAMDVYIDNILACKASSSADSITLTSLISKNSAASGGNEAWYPIQSINDTTITIDNLVDTLVSEGRGYTGTSEAAELYKRETIKSTPQTTSTGYVHYVNGNGTEAGGYIEYQCGYDASTGEQNGETWLDGQNGQGAGFTFSNAGARSFIKLNRLSVCRFYIGITLYSLFNCAITMHGITACTSTLYGSGHEINKCKITITNQNNNSGLQNNAYNQDSEFAFTNLIGNLYDYGHIYKGGEGSKYYITRYANNLSYLILVEQTRIYNMTSCQRIDARSSGGLFNCIIDDTTEYSSESTYKYSGKVFSHNHDNTPGNHLMMTSYATVQTSTSSGDLHTAGGTAWKMTLSNALRSVYWPVTFPVAQIAVNASTLVTVSLWMKRSSNTGVAGRLVCRKDQLAGIDSDVSTSITAASDTWEQVTITFTPSVAGVVEIEVEGYLQGGASSGTICIDDFAVSQA